MSLITFQSVKPCTVVLKLGTSSIIDEIDHSTKCQLLKDVSETVAVLKKAGYTVVIVSSGAVGFGLQKLGLAERPSEPSEKQALAAVGQGEMVSTWSEVFAPHGITIAQLLLAHADLVSPERYTNAVKTIRNLFESDVVPIINENDTLPSKMRIGDNDTLAALVASMIQAEYVFLLTDVDALYNSNPKSDLGARRIEQVYSINLLKSKLDCDNLGAGTPNGTGGMATKLRAAEIAMASGISTVITSSSNPAVVIDILKYHTEERKSSNVSDSSEESMILLSGDSVEAEAALRPAHTLFCPLEPSKPSPVSSLFDIPSFSVGMT